MKRKLLTVAAIGMAGAIVLAGCTMNPLTTGCLERAESMVLTNPDSALLMLDGIAPNNLHVMNLARYNLLRTVIDDRLGFPHEFIDDILAARDVLSDQAAPDSQQAVANLYVGRVYESLMKYEDSMNAYLDADRYASRTTNNSYWKGRINYHIAELFHQDFDYDRSSAYLEQAIRFFVDSKDMMSAAHALNLQGFNYKLAGNHSQALSALGKANEIYMEENNIDGVMSNAIIMSDILLEQPNGAHRADSLMERIYFQFKGGVIPISHYPMMSRIEAGKENYGKAIEFLQKYTDLTPDLTLEDRATISYSMSEHYDSLRRYDLALNHLRTYTALDDSMHQNKIKTVLKEVELKYEKQELEEAHATYRRNTVFGVIIGSLLLIGIIVVLVYEMKRRRLKSLTLQADLDRLRHQMNEFDDLRDNLSAVLDQKVKKERRLQEVLVEKMCHIQRVVEIMFLNENHPEQFKKVVRTALVDAERDTYFGELQEVVNEKFCGVVDYLRETYPSLSTEELNLCCLIYFGFNNSQISILFGHTNANSIFNKRSTLKKKLGIPPQNSLNKQLLLIAEKRI